MPILSNLKRERFARAYIELGSNRRAYVAAGYRARLWDDLSKSVPVDACAARLLRDAKVTARIQELREAMAKRADITEDSIADELEQARLGAMKCEQHAAAVSATVAKAKLVGLMVDRKEVRQGEIESMTEEELRACLADGLPAVTHDGSPSKQ
jgi:phage terminase small subunit